MANARAGGKGKLWRKIAVGVVVVPLLLFGYVAVIGSYLLWAEADAEPFVVNPESLEHGLDVQAVLRGINPTSGELAVRLELWPAESLLDPATGALAQDVRVLVYSVSGPVEVAFEKGRHMSPVEVTLGLYGGLASEYPLDMYNASLSVSATMPDPEDAEATPYAIPVALTLHPSLHGFMVWSEPTELNTDYDAHIVMEINRSLSTLFFAGFIVLAMWLLSITTAFIAVAVVRGREPTLEMMAYMGALLFAFPALRDSAPGTPPVGALFDVMAFFWAEGIVALALTAVVATWLLRPPVPEAPPAPAPLPEAVPAPGPSPPLP